MLHFLKPNSWYGYIIYTKQVYYCIMTTKHARLQPENDRKYFYKIFVKSVFLFSDR